MDGELGRKKYNFNEEVNIISGYRLWPICKLMAIKWEFA